MKRLLLLVAVGWMLPAAELLPVTVKAWDEYVRAADARMQERPGGRSFLWVDESDDRRTRVRRGEVLVAPVVGRGAQSVANGLIHHWIGAAFIPGGTIETLWAVVHDYDRYKEIYKPAVTDSKTLACTPTDQEFSMVWQRRVLFTNAAMEGRYRAHDVLVGGRRGYSIASTIQVQEIEDYGRASERFLAPGTGNGFMWRVHSIARYEERDGGLYFELEAIALTRDIPASLRWVAAPVVNRLSVDSMTATMRDTRHAMNSLAAKTEPTTGCKGRGFSDSRGGS